MGRPCEACGFDSAEDDRACPLCGASATLVVTGSHETLVMPPELRAAQSARAVPEIGLVYGDRFRVDALIGRGGMGQVYRVHDLSTGLDRALKVLIPEAQGDPGRAQRFRREIELLSRVDHPAVLRPVACGSSGDELFLVTEYIDGQDLKTLIQTRGRWPPAEAAALAATVCEALGAAHALGIVHRDVKPNNIMLARDGSLHLLDFGLARGVGIDVATLTRTGTIVGTPAYMSPEQFEASDVDERSDLYSFGIVLFELLTGRLPFTGSSPVAVAIAHKTSPPPALRPLAPETPAWLERLVLRCLEKDPAQRFASAAEVLAELRRPRVTTQPRPRRLATGDWVVEDEGQVTSWALRIESSEPKDGWQQGMALSFSGRFYRLDEIEETASGRTAYGFSFWPEGEVFRRLLEYEQDCAERAARRQQSLSGRLQRWFGQRRE